MPTFALLLMPIVLGIFNVRVDWSAPDHRAIAVAANPQNEFITQCLHGGLEVRFRFFMRLCRRRSGWFDSCGPERIETHSVRYDPISQNYSVVMDTLRDTKAPQSTIVESAQDALELTASLRSLNLADLPGAGTRNNSAHPYVGVRVFSECREKSSNLLARIPSMISFGLLDFSTTDSGWINFDVSNAIVSR